MGILRGAAKGLTKPKPKPKAKKRGGYRRDFDPYEVKDTDPKYLQKATLQQRKDWHKQKMSPAQAEALKKGTKYPPSALKGGGPAYGKWWSEMKKYQRRQNASVNYHHPNKGLDLKDQQLNGLFVVNQP